MSRAKRCCCCAPSFYYISFVFPFSDKHLKCLFIPICWQVAATAVLCCCYCCCCHCWLLLSQWSCRCHKTNSNECRAAAARDATVGGHRQCATCHQRPAMSVPLSAWRETGSSTVPAATPSHTLHAVPRLAAYVACVALLPHSLSRIADMKEAT